MDIKGDVCIVPPNSFALARTVEYFRIPRDVLTICLGKSTYARCGIIVNVTPFEPEWEGFVTLEISQHHAAAGARSTPTRASRRCCSSRATRPAKSSYADKKGKYQKQTGVTLAEALGQEHRNTGRQEGLRGTLGAGERRPYLGLARLALVTDRNRPPFQVKRQVASRRTWVTMAGRKQATHVPPACRTLGYTTPSDPASSSRAASR